MRSTIALTLSAVAVVFFALTAAGSLSERTFGLTTVPAPSSCALLVTGVSVPGHAPLGTGDTIDARKLTSHERLRLMVPRSTDAMMLPAHRMESGGQMAMVMVTPMESVPGDAAYLRLGVLLLLMLLGLYVLWRGRDAASLGLGIFFATMPAFFLSHAYPQLPDQAIVAVLFAATLLNLLGYFGLFVMVDALAARALGPVLRFSARSVAVGALALAGWILISSTYGRVFTGCPPLVNVQIVLACYAAVIVACFVLLWRGIAASDRADRGRLRWVFWSTAIGFSGPLLSFAFISSHQPLPLYGIFNLTFAAIPIGYTYAVLRHRVIDVGFVLNRAISLTILTTAIVALFVLAENLIERLAVGRAESVFIQLGFSLGLGMAFNKAHARLESWLERILLRRRYELEESLDELGRQADACTDEDVLAAEVVGVLQERLQLLGCAFYRESNDGFALVFGSGDVTFAPSVDAEGFTLPLRVRGRVYGGIVLVEDPRAEAFAMEEVELLDALANRLAAAITALRAEKYEQLLKGRTAS